MLIKDRGMVIDLSDSDPRTQRIRAVLFAQPSASDPLGALWSACSTQQRAVLVALAEHGELEQVALEHILGVTGVALRGRHSGLARIAKRLGVDYPIRSSAGRRDSRRFALVPTVAQEILKLANKNPKNRRTP
jgi:hypothetical protein